MPQPTRRGGPGTRRGVPFDPDVLADMFTGVGLRDLPEADRSPIVALANRLADPALRARPDDVQRLYTTLDLPVANGRRPRRRRPLPRDPFITPESRAFSAALEQHPDPATRPSELIPVFGAGGDPLRSQQVVELLLAGGLALAAQPDPTDPLVDTLMKVAFSTDTASTLLRSHLTKLPLGAPEPSLTNLPAVQVLPACYDRMATALKTWVAAWQAAVVTGDASKITRLNPVDACARDTLEIHGNGFGAQQPAEMRVLLASGKVQVQPTAWSDNRIDVTVPEGFVRGSVGLYDWTPFVQAQQLEQQAINLKQELTHCLHPDAGLVADETLRGGARLLAPRINPAPLLPGRENFFNGGPPDITEFVALPGRGLVDGTDIPLLPDSPVTIKWDTVGATHVEIAAVQVGGSQHELPPLGGQHAASGSLSVVVPGTKAWTAAYELRAFNRCTGPGNPTTARLPFRMRRKVAFALSGGGAHGDFQLGAIRYLYEAHNVRPELVTGTSVGAINGVKLAEGYADSDRRLENIWSSLVRNDHMWVMQPWLNQIDAGIKALFLSAVAKGHSPAAAVQKMMDAVFRLAANPLLVAVTAITKMVAGVMAAFNAKSIYRLDPIEQKLRDPTNLNLARIRGGQSNVELILAAVGLETGQLKYIDQTGTLYHITADGAWHRGPTVDLIKAVMASASIPAVFEPVELAGEWCVDGGVREMIPVRAAVQSGGYDIYAISASAPPPPAALGSFADKKLADIAMRSIGDLMCDELSLSDQLRLAEWPASVQLHRIQPSWDVNDTTQINPGLIRIARDYGWMRAGEVLTVTDRLGEAMASSDAITRARKDAWNPEENLFGEVRAVTAEDVAAARAAKRRLKVLHDARVGAGWPMPPGDLTQWWMGWEKHVNGPGATEINPWTAFRDIIPPEAPP